LRAGVGFVRQHGCGRSTGNGVEHDIDFDRVRQRQDDRAQGRRRATLRLPENPSTGYRWALDAEDSNLVDVTQSEYAPASTAPGAGGEARWTIKARAPGSTTVKLKRWRPWEGDKSVVERYDVTIKVSS
jgi:inhibitor of cysteine peptidase